MTHIAELKDMPLSRLAELLITGELQASEVYLHYHELITQQEPQLHAFSHLQDPERVLVQLRAMTLQRKARGPLWAIPTADKDLVNREGMPTGFGAMPVARIETATETDNFAAQMSAVDAVSIGKTTTAEFGLYGFAETVPGAHTRNPQDLTRSPGGSSTGAGAALGAGLLPFTAGSDAGGSIRIPAAAVGKVGFKVSPGIYENGRVDLERTSVPGFLSHTVEDGAFLLSAIRPEYYDYTQLPADIEKISGLRLGATLGTPWDAVTDLPVYEGALQAWQYAQQLFSGAGLEVGEYRFFTDHKYGESFNENWKYSVTQIERGGIPPEDFFSPFTYQLYLAGQQVAEHPGALETARDNLTDFAVKFRAEFQKFDVLLTPAVLDQPTPLGHYDLSSVDRCLEQQVQYSPHTSYLNVAGCPAITVPVLRDSDGFIVSVQLAAAPGQEAHLLAVARYLELARGTGF